jgi:HAMP domain-containing protein
MVTQYTQALTNAVNASKGAHSGTEAAAALSRYEQTGEQLHEAAEDGEIAGREVAQTYQEQIERTSKRSVELVIGISIAGLVLALAVSLMLANAILTPVGHLRDVAESVSLGNLDIAVRRYSEDEIGDLADSFGRMVTAVKFFRMEMEEAQASPRGVV